MIVSKLEEISAIGYPRSPSFPPSSKIKSLRVVLTEYVVDSHCTAL